MELSASEGEWLGNNCRGLLAIQNRGLRSSRSDDNGVQGIVADHLRLIESILACGLSMYRRIPGPSP